MSGLLLTSLPAPSPLLLLLLPLVRVVSTRETPPPVNAVELGSQVASAVFPTCAAMEKLLPTWIVKLPLFG